MSDSVVVTKPNSSPTRPKRAAQSFRIEDRTPAAKYLIYGHYGRAPFEPDSAAALVSYPGATRAYQSSESLTAADEVPVTLQYVWSPSSGEPVTVVLTLAAKIPKYTVRMVYQCRGWSLDDYGDGDPWPESNPVRLSDCRFVSLSPSLISEDQMREVIGRIDELQRLPRNWDGDDALPVSQSTIARAKEFIQQLAARAFVSRTRWRQPSVAPNPDGGVDLTWDAGTRWASISLLADATDVECVTQEAGSAPVYRTTSERDAIELALWAMRGL